MALRVRLRNVNPATKAPVRAIAVIGRLNNGTKGLKALINIPKTMLTR